MKKIFFEFLMSLGFTIIGWWLIICSWHFLVTQGIELSFRGHKDGALFSLFFGQPIGGILGILLAEKLVYRTKGWSILGTAIALLLGIASSSFGVYMMDEEGSILILLLPVLVALISTISYNFKLLFK